MPLFYPPLDEATTKASSPSHPPHAASIQSQMLRVVLDVATSLPAITGITAPMFISFVQAQMPLIAQHPVSSVRGGAISTIFG